MSTEPRCRCASCTIRGLMGPAIVITIGILFLLDRLHAGHFYFGTTWPVLLLVIGFLRLGASLASREGHVGAATGAPPQASPPAPPGSAPQTPYGSQGQ